MASSATKPKFSEKITALFQTMRDRRAKKFKTYIVDKAGTTQGTGNPPTDTDLLNYLISSGIDYNGQINYAFQQKGGNGTFGVEVDVFKVAGLTVGLPFLPVTLNVNPSTSVEAARHRMLLVERQGESSKPVAFEDLRGVTGSASLDLKVDFGPSWTPTKDVPGLEELGLSFSIGATGNVAVKGTGSYLRTCDDGAQFFTPGERSSGLKDALNKALTTSGSSLKTLKAFKPLCSFTKWNMGTTSSAGLEASIKAKLALFKQEKQSEDEEEDEGKGNISASATLAGPSFEGEWTWSGYRLQTQASDGIVMTQDVHVTYKKVSGTLLKVKLKGEAALEPPPVKLPPLEKEYEDVGNLGEKTTKVFLNALSYRGSVVYWDPKKGAPIAGVSGWQAGTSVTIDNLTALVDGGMTEKRKAKFLATLARAVNTTPDAVQQLLDKAKDMIASVAMDTQAQPDALFLEATFPLGSITSSDLFKAGKTTATGPASVLDKFPAVAAPQTLRLRYRMGDKGEKSTTLIKLGFTWTVGFNFEISKFEKYGSGGWFDVYTLGEGQVPPAMLVF